ncbi:hypothetical protein NPIL_72291 [Nephila pilipes]|uniref:Uncharacterized protein n=1 Tax=Nephila pilipes TaxID=299642 RepID=A0A8X6NIT7_NEPPI|nr:hypothetical protein NPIL_72291 [Nephila pilipes]
MCIINEERVFNYTLVPRIAENTHFNPGKSFSNDLSGILCLAQFLVKNQSNTIPKIDPTYQFLHVSLIKIELTIQFVFHHLPALFLYVLGLPLYSSDHVCERSCLPLPGGYCIPDRCLSTPDVF